MIEGPTIQRRTPALSWLGLATVAALVSGCASAATTGNMVLPQGALPTPPADLALSQKLRIASVSSGKEWKPFGLAPIGDSEFRAALEQSLLSAGLLAPPSFTAKYFLEAELLKVDFTGGSSDITVTMSVDYRLKEAATGTLVWQYTISTSYTAKFSEAYYGPKRLSLADEGAARANIKELVDTLYQIGSARLDV